MSEIEWALMQFEGGKLLIRHYQISWLEMFRCCPEISQKSRHFSFNSKNPGIFLLIYKNPEIFVSIQKIDLAFPFLPIKSKFPSHYPSNSIKIPSINFRKLQSLLTDQKHPKSSSKTIFLLPCTYKPRLKWIFFHRRG